MIRICFVSFLGIKEVYRNFLDYPNEKRNYDGVAKVKSSILKCNKKIFFLSGFILLACNI